MVGSRSINLGLSALARYSRQTACLPEIRRANKVGGYLDNRLKGSLPCDVTKGVLLWAIIKGATCQTKMSTFSSTSIRISNMASIFHSHTSSYASEQLQFQLSALSTLPITFPPSTQLHVQQSTTPKPHLQSALSELSSSKPINKERLQQILEDLSSAKEQEGYATEQLSEIDELVEVEVMGRAVTVLWKEVLDAFIDGALNLERERVWWDSVLNSRRGVSVYLIQSKERHSCSPANAHSAQPCHIDCGMPSLLEPSYLFQT